MSRFRLIGLLTMAATGVFILAACAEQPTPTATPVTFDPTPATTERPSNGGETPSPTATTAPGPGGGDPASGEALFTANGCNACHSTGSNTIVGPGLAGLNDRAGDRKPGLSAEEYITESIMDPTAFVVEGFNPLMPEFPQLSDSDVDDLVAYLMTLE